MLHKKIKNLLENNYGVEVNIEECTSDIIWGMLPPIPVNGCAFVNSNVDECLIDVFYKPGYFYDDLISSCLIHEFGHILDRHEEGEYKEYEFEKRAWELGEKFFKDLNLFPDQKVFDDLKNFSLNWYSENV